jgi:hypothetical protein
MTRWSQPSPLAAEFLRKLPPGRPGVYRIRALDGAGQPVPFRRLNDIDQEGILHIGQSRNVRERLTQFTRSAASGPKNY